jgi:hypothetical protein
VATVRELRRVVRPGGTVQASHYVRSEARGVRRVKRKLTLGYYNLLRGRLSRMERFPLLMVTGSFAALSYVPLLGWLVRRSGTAMYSDLMPDFKTTWTNTFDLYGNHHFQRYVTPEEFRGFFEDAGGFGLQVREPGVLLATRTA